MFVFAVFDDGDDYDDWWCCLFHCQVCFMPGPMKMTLVNFEMLTPFCDWDACHDYTNRASTVGLDADQRAIGAVYVCE